MCGILGIVSSSDVNQKLYEGLQVLQHRGQDAAGIITAQGNRFHNYKGSGLVRDVFTTRSMMDLRGSWGAAHCRYPTAGAPYSPSEAQPFYVNSPYGLALVHNGNLINGDQLTREVFEQDLRQINTSSDSEILLNVFANELQSAVHNSSLNDEAVFKAVAGVHRRCSGSYSAIVLIAGYGLLAFRDPFGIRPLIIGHRQEQGKNEYIVASESVALDLLGFEIFRDVTPGEAVLIGTDGTLRAKVCSKTSHRLPCLFEYIYLARPDSIIDGISVYESRLKMGEVLAARLKSKVDIKLDAVIPIPDSSRPAAMEVAKRLGVDYREGFVKNRYVGRTFIMPGQAIRKKSIRQKLNAISQEFQGKNVLLVDDSIVRGTTSREIVQMAKSSGAMKVYFASAAPPIRFQNVYGIDMPNQNELIAAHLSDEEVCKEICADKLIYQDLDELIVGLKQLGHNLDGFETSCFSGKYVTGGVTQEYLTQLEVTSGARQTTHDYVC